MAFSADAHMEAISQDIKNSNSEVLLIRLFRGFAWPEKHQYDESYRNQAVEMLGQKLNTDLNCSTKRRIVRDGARKH